jgi:hypothetical protein
MKRMIKPVGMTRSIAVKSKVRAMPVIDRLLRLTIVACLLPGALAQCHSPRSECEANLPAIDTCTLLPASSPPPEAALQNICHLFSLSRKKMHPIVRFLT